MELGEKMSYLQGLLDGLEIDTSTKEGKLLVQMTEVMKEMADSIDDLQDQIYELTELCDVLDEDLGAVEEDIYECDCHHDHDCCDDDDDDYDYELDEDEDLYEVCCPVCDEKVVLDESMLDEGSIECPNCGENLEFDLFDDDSEEEE